MKLHRPVEQPEEPDECTDDLVVEGRDRNVSTRMRQCLQCGRRDKRWLVCVGPHDVHQVSSPREGGDIDDLRDHETCIARRMRGRICSLICRPERLEFDAHVLTVAPTSGRPFEWVP